MLWVLANWYKYMYTFFVNTYKYRNSQTPKQIFADRTKIDFDSNNWNIESKTRDLKHSSRIRYHYATMLELIIIIK